jgi:hypothetical protein
VSTDESRVEVHPDRYAVVDFDPELTFECVDECTWCCHHGVLLYGQDLPGGTTRGHDHSRRDQRGNRETVRVKPRD